MRRALLALLLIAVASPALAGQATIPVAPKPKPVPMQAPIDTQSFILPAPIPLAASRPGGDTGQCKATCSRTLYFCNAGGDDDGCGARWAQCSASCSATYSSPRFVGR
jgi:hypothetical protein